MATLEIIPAVPTPNAIEVFCSYSHKDDHLREELETHLSILQAHGVINSWHDHAIPPGKEWQSQIDERLNSAQIILLLISPDFLASKYCREVEVKRALERHNTGEARVISILLRDVDWHGSPLSKLQALPKDARPVTSWANRDQAFKDVTIGIRKVAEDLRKHRIVPVAAPHVRRANDRGSEPRPKSGLSFTRKYGLLLVASVLILCGLTYLAMRNRAAKKLRDADWAHALYNDSRFADCMEVQPCTQRKAQADQLRSTSWAAVPFDFPLLNDCMAYPACAERATQAARLRAVKDWRKLTPQEQPLLKDCMGYAPCTKRPHAPLQEPEDPKDEAPNQHSKPIMYKN